jgi:hypothetical protein
MLDIGEFYHLEFELLYCDWKSTPLHFKNLIKNNFFFLKQNTKWINLFWTWSSHLTRLNNVVKGMSKKLLMILCFFLLHSWHLLIVTWSIYIFLINKKSLHLFLVLLLAWLNGMFSLFWARPN